MVTRDVVDRLVTFNTDRQTAGVRHKFALMAQDPFSFFRGSCHLFYEDLVATNLAAIHNTPPVWICGDLHWQNFGSFKGNDRLVYFDINDFDESCLAPCGWEIVRFLTSLFVGQNITGFSLEATTQLAQHFLDTYTTELRSGKSRTIHRETAKGVVGELLEDLRQRDRAKFLADRTTRKHQLKLIDGKTEAIDPEHKTAIADALAHWASTQPDPEFYTVHDIVHRIAGNGSLGLARYLILVEGKGSPDRNYLLDLKAARSSSVRSPLPQPLIQPQWPSDADGLRPTEGHRIIASQERWQESAPDRLHSLTIGTIPFVLRELQPSADKVDVNQLRGKPKRLTKLVETMAQVTAWGQLRSSGRDGSAIADELINFAQAANLWQPDWLDYAQTYAQQVINDHQIFRSASPIDPAIIGAE
jgi:uncharacterized protein (DUF2252 family)